MNKLLSLDRKTTQALAWNVLLTGWVVAVVWLDTNWLTYPLVAFVWVMLATYVSVYFTRPKPEFPSPLPLWLTGFQDVFIFGCLLYADHILTAGVYAASCVVLELVQMPKRLEARHG